MTGADADVVRVPNTGVDAVNELLSWLPNVPVPNAKGFAACPDVDRLVFPNVAGAGLGLEIVVAPEMKTINWILNYPSFSNSKIKLLTSYDSRR